MPEVEGVRFGIQRIVVVGNNPVWIPARAISLRQPWAYLMLALPDDVRKDVENRPTGFVAINFRGPVWVHSSGTVQRKQYEVAIRECLKRRVPSEWLPSWEETRKGSRPGLETGCVLGQMTVDDYLAPTDASKRKWLFPHHHGFMTSDPQVLRTPVPAKGHLGFWRVPDELAKTLASRVKYPRGWNATSV